MKHALLAAALVLVAGSAVACGGDAGGAPTDASKADFCDGYQSLFTDLAAMSEDGDAPSEADSLKAVKSWAKEMEDIGTPEAMSDDAREGFELTLDEVGDLDLDELKDTSLEDLGADITDEEKKQAEAFTTYVTESCGNPLEDLLPSDAPS